MNVGDPGQGKEPGQARFPPHFDGKRFYNPNGRQARGFRDFLRWQFTTRRVRSPNFVDDVQQSIPPEHVSGNELLVTLVNHSTVLLQQHGLNILTDPIWSERASPFSWIGPRRRRAPGIAWENLPQIDIVLISHNHYDHLDLPTIRKLAARGTPTFMVPSKLGDLLASEHIGPAQKLDWGESLAIHGCRVHCVPALHFSGRTLFDRNRTLWCGYVIESQNGTIYFAGDTAIGDHFAQIRERFGTPRLALLPIGAYEPRWFMSAVHMDPEDAVKAHQILGAETSVAIHHGTFQLTDEGIGTPGKRLRQIAAHERFLVVANGRSVQVA